MVVDKKTEREAESESDQDAKDKSLSTRTAPMNESCSVKTPDRSTALAVG